MTGYGLFVLALIGLSSAVFLDKIFPIDTTVLEAIRQLHSPPMDSLMVGITRLGDPFFTVPTVFVVLAILWLQKHRAEASIFLLNCFGGAVFSTGLKLLFGKVRPDLWTSTIVETTFSYPSGHALGSVVLYGFLAYLLGKRLPQHKRFIYAASVLICLAIGFSRLYLGVHWPTDLAGGYLIGTLWTNFCINLLRKSEPKTA